MIDGVYCGYSTRMGPLVALAGTSMRDPFKMIVTLALVMLSGLVWIILTQSDWDAGISPAIFTLMPARQLTSSQSAPNAARLPRSRPPHWSVASDMRQGLASLSVPIELLKPAPVLIKNSFPIDWRIPPGTPQSMVLAMYGRPAFSVTIPDRGQLVERYIYIDRSTGRRTFVLFTNSIVTSALTSKD
jgi:hypothetical protein